jgi:hypothetical protein
VFPPSDRVEIHTRYDLKGSWVNRSKKTRRKLGRGQLKVKHGDEGVLKDCDLHSPFLLDEEMVTFLIEQSRIDSQKLCSWGIMDYSLLVGITDREYKFEDGNGGALPSGVGQMKQDQEAKEDEDESIHHEGIHHESIHHGTKFQTPDFSSQVGGDIDGRGAMGGGSGPVRPSVRASTESVSSSRDSRALSCECGHYCECATSHAPVRQLRELVGSWADFTVLRQLVLSVPATTTSAL